METNTERPAIVRGGWWVVAQVPLIALACLLPVWWRDPARTDAQRLLRLAGGALLLGAVSMVVAAGIALGRHLTPFPRPRDNAPLRDRGVYGVVRHPIYCGLVLSSLGWSLWSLSWPGLLFTVFLGVFFDRKAAYEESWLVRRFPAYRDYQKRVRKLIPGIY